MGKILRIIFWIIPFFLFSCEEDLINDSSINSVFLSSAEVVDLATVQVDFEIQEKLPETEYYVIIESYDQYNDKLILEKKKQSITTEFGQNSIELQFAFYIDRKHLIYIQYEDEYSISKSNEVQLYYNTEDFDFFIESIYPDKPILGEEIIIEFSEFYGDNNSTTLTVQDKRIFDFEIVDNSIKFIAPEKGEYSSISLEVSMLGKKKIFNNISEYQTPIIDSIYPQSVYPGDTIYVKIQDFGYNLEPRLYDQFEYVNQLTPIDLDSGLYYSIMPKPFYNGMSQPYEYTVIANGLESNKCAPVLYKFPDIQFITEFEQYIDFDKKYYFRSDDLIKYENDLYVQFANRIIDLQKEFTMGESIYSISFPNIDYDQKSGLLSFRLFDAIRYSENTLKLKFVLKQIEYLGEGFDQIFWIGNRWLNITTAGKIYDMISKEFIGNSITGNYHSNTMYAVFDDKLYVGGGGNGESLTKNWFEFNFNDYSYMQIVDSPFFPDIPPKLSLRFNDVVYYLREGKESYSFDVNQNWEIYEQQWIPNIEKDVFFNEPTQTIGSRTYLFKGDIYFWEKHDLNSQHYSVPIDVTCGIIMDNIAYLIDDEDKLYKYNITSNALEYLNIQFPKYHNIRQLHFYEGKLLFFKGDTINELDSDFLTYD
ncbi:hypothetical protein N9L20_08335 [Flavobacteriaceae bacterium]|nr:hypothetical protein [Flavobacteriaceae bacterium]